MNDHRIPAIDRAFDVIDALARRPGGTISAVTAALGIPRSTVYRILNSLEARGIVVRDVEGAYELGPQLIRLAGAVSKGVDLVTLARPYMERLATDYKVTVKLSVLDQGTALVVAVAESPSSYSVTTKIGSRFPLHAGAASKVLLANASPEFQDEYLSGKLDTFTAQTVSDPRKIRRMLAQVREQDYAEDRSEFVPGVTAVAAPVFDPRGSCVCALSVPYLSTASETTSQRLRKAVIGTAKSLTRQLGGQS